MVHIYTFCNKTLIGRRENLSSKFLCEGLYKLNYKISETMVVSSNYDFSSLDIKNKEMYFFLLDKANPKLNLYLSELSSCQLSENAKLKECVCDIYKKANMPLDKFAENEYTIPETASPILNSFGKTQGYKINIGESQVFVLPNEFLEFKNIYNIFILNELEKNGNEYISETYKTFGLTEEKIKLLLGSIINNKHNVKVLVFSEGIENNVVIKAKQPNLHFEDYRRQIFNILEKYIYSVQGLSLTEQLNDLILQKNVKISLAGDCMIAGMVNYLNMQNIANNLVDCAILPNQTSIAKFLRQQKIENGADYISSQTAYEIAVQVLNNNSLDLAVVCLSKKEGAFSNNFIAIGNRRKIDVYKYAFAGTDEEIKKNTIKSIMFCLIKKIMLNDYKIIE